MTKLTLIKTCEACPEQYNVFRDEDKVGYIRLRNGFLSVYCPDCFKKCVYSKKFNNENLDWFKSEKERKKYLNLCKQRIKEFLKDNIVISKTFSFSCPKTTKNKRFIFEKIHKKFSKFERRMNKWLLNKMEKK